MRDESNDNAMTNETSVCNERDSTNGTILDSQKIMCKMQIAKNNRSPDGHTSKTFRNHLNGRSWLVLAFGAFYEKPT